jgi:hypothetical protein
LADPVPDANTVCAGKLALRQAAKEGPKRLVEMPKTCCSAEKLKPVCRAEQNQATGAVEI